MLPFMSTAPRPPDLAIRQHAGERRMGPIRIAAGRNDIGMPG